MTESFITLQTLRSYTREGRALILDYGGPRVAITVLTDSLIRVRLAPDGTFAARRSWAVARADDEFPEASFEIEESGQTGGHEGPHSASTPLPVPQPGSPPLRVRPASLTI